MRNIFFSASLIAALSLVGCGDDTRPGPTATPVAIDEFCTEFVDAVCDDVATCSCGATADADCRSELATNCGGAAGVFGPDVRARVEAGTVIYDADAAGALVAQLRTQTSCNNPIVALGWNIGDLFTFGGVLSGTLAPGASCAGGGESPFGGACASGVCTEVGGAPRCIALAGLGAPCGIGVDAVCADVNASFTSLENADFLLRCNIAAGATMGTCAALLAEGATCARAAECASGRCASTVCAPPLANGAECVDDNECSSGFCRSTSAEFACAAAATVNNGGACGDDAECVSGACQRDVCIASICNTFEGMSTTP